MAVIHLRAAAQRYDWVSIWLHWLTAALVGGLWLLAHTIDWFPSGAPRVAVRSTHIALGVTLGVILVARVVWRLGGVGGGARHLPPADTGVLGLASRLVHLLLYALVAAVVLAGLANTWVRGDNIFGLFSIPAFDPGNRALRGTVGEVHKWLANGILALAGLHALAALGHHFVLKDGVLRRMVPWLPPAG